MKRRIFATLLALCMCIALLSATVFAAEVYSRDDIEVVNGIIDAHPELGWEKAPVEGSSKPDDWNNKVYWDFGVSPRRVIDLDLMGENLTGSLNVSGLTALRALNCSFNQLTGLDVSGLTALTRLDCRFNELTGTLDVSGMATLTRLDCSFNQLTGLVLNNGANYQYIDARANCMTNTSAVTGSTIPWGDVNLKYQFNPQHYTIRNILTNMTTDNPANFRLMTDETDYTAKLSADNGYMLPPEISVRVGETELTRNKDYTYDSGTGDLTISANSIYDNLEQPNIFVFRPNSVARSGGGTRSKGGDIEIEAKGVPIVRYVTVQTEGNGIATATPASGIMGTEITLNATPDSGWQLKKWEAVSGDITMAGNKFTMPNSDVVVKAIFDEIPAATYTISVTGGEAHVEGTRVNKAEAGVKVDLIASVPEGKIFDKWSILDGVSELVLADANTATTSFTMPAKSVSLEAVFKNKLNEPKESESTISDAEETVIFDPAGGKWEDGITAPKIIKARVGEQITIIEAPDKEGYEFQYWQGSKYQPGEKYQVPKGGHTFTAVWVKTATIKPNDPTETVKPTKTTTPTETIKLTDTTKPSDSGRTPPKTGENIGTYMWSNLILFAAGGLMLVLRKKKLEQRD
ncbi:MAG: hypothetical protein GX218_01570 [Clostridiaceae bacterium]|nr:hypothetical protein [Clostridiaceae bacterium]